MIVMEHYLIATDRIAKSPLYREILGPWGAHCFHRDECDNLIGGLSEARENPRWSPGYLFLGFNNQEFKKHIWHNHWGDWT